MIDWLKFDELRTKSISRVTQLFFFSSDGLLFSPALINSSGFSKTLMKEGIRFLHFPPSTYLWSTAKLKLATLPTTILPSSTTGYSWTAFKATNVVQPVNPKLYWKNTTEWSSCILKSKHTDWSQTSSTELVSFDWQWFNVESQVMESKVRDLYQNGD